jgi:ATP-dependent exoDNAse (exonuclease V) alpha subunit
METVDTTIKSSGKTSYRHLSIRVPWHDSGWTGCVCADPKANADCLALDQIRIEKDDIKENSVAGCLFSDLSQDQFPACAKERGSFMAPFEFTRMISHPYVETSDLHKHILATAFRHPPYSAAGLPFRWMLKKNAWDIADELELKCDQGQEPELPFPTSWVQSQHNQKELLDAFFSFLNPGKSLCFFYAKQTPLADDNRRVLIGVGRVLHIGPSVEYEYSTKGFRCLIWDRIIQHSVRPDFKDGFILPYQAILKKAEEDPSIDPAEYVAFAPEDRRIEFSYATEHVTHDGAIGALLSCALVLRKMSLVLGGSFEAQLKWIDRRLAELWKLRGPCPGLGAALCAFGINHGNLVAHELSSKLGENEDPWPLVDKVFDDPSLLSKELAANIGKTLQTKWKKLPDERRQLLKLLSRFEISVEQATRFYVEEERTKCRIECTEGEIIANPYMLYEIDRFSSDSVSFNTIDRGMFPEAIIRNKHPIPEPSALDGATDGRRVRALVVDILEHAADDGHTLFPQSQIIQSIRELPLEPECPVDRDLISVVEDEFDPVIQLASMKDGARAYQLDRLAKMRDIIRKTVEKRLANKRHVFSHGETTDWREYIDSELQSRAIETSLDEEEERARSEKAAALKELAESWFSVVVGPAGTGKTNIVISALCRHPEITNGEILLLAPTGKARVRMQQATDLPAQTIAQFLRGLDRYDETTGIYRLSDEEKEGAYKTVIVDEASMLTEEQLGALLDSLKGVQRLILVGDKRQLPPIGAGRPFVDIITRLAPADVETIFPRVSVGYAELTVRRRQTGAIREDLRLADWFSGQSLEATEDEIFDLVLKKQSDRLQLIQWENPDEIQNKILEVLERELKLSDVKDSRGFELSLGGKQSGQYVYFNRGAAKDVEGWQILSPLKGRASGVKEINRLVQKTFRSGMLKLANEYRSKRIPPPLGPDEIVYGDKVINTANNRRYQVYPKENALQYVANGEIGIVVGKFRGMYEKWKGQLPTNVEFSSQLGFTYDYGTRDFKEEGSPILELAYAITVHKSQGSDFDLCVLVLPNPCRLLSRELLYTALTRQRLRLVILHQGNWGEFKKYSSAFYSETARRLTNLFSDPDMVPIKDRFFENQLIHRTRRGEPVRSKSEVIIADNLLSEDIEYTYEKKLVGNDGTEKYPDFTIEDESGIPYYWEHLGMLQEEDYKRKWKKKLEWYRSQDILPYDEGGGKKGSLVITQDTEKGGISSENIKRLIQKVFGKT